MIAPSNSVMIPEAMTQPPMRGRLHLHRQHDPHNAGGDQEESEEKGECGRREKRVVTAKKPPTM